MTILKWFLLTLGIFYFLNGAAKIRNGGLDWFHPDSLQRYLLVAQTTASGSIYVPLNELVVQSDLLATVGTVSNFVLEIGFLLAILAGISITPFFIGLIGFHSFIAVTMSPFFFDNYLYLLLFLPWDDLHARFSDRSELTVVYDDHCHFCVRSLLIIRWFDTADLIRFVPNTERDEDEFDYDAAMYVFAADGSFRGYHGFRRVLHSYWSTRPVALLMALPGVRNVGESIYNYVASNRSSYFVCDVEEQPPG